MGKKNRKVSNRLSVHATNTMRFGGILVLLGVMIIINVLSSSSCTQLLNEKGGREQELAKLNDAYCRESTAWEEMLTPEKVERALRAHGLRMTMPRPDQIIRLKENGVPYPNQLALTRLRQRASVGATASAASPSRRTASRARVR